MKEEKLCLESLPVAGERKGQKAKEREPVSLYNTHSLLLNSTNTHCSPHTRIPPVFCPRVYGSGESEIALFGVDHPSIRPPRGADAPGGAVSVPNDSGGTSVPGTETNGMQGPLIPFCALCGRDLEPQKTRRGETKHFCSDACRSKAWRRVHPIRTRQNVKGGSDE